MAKIVVIQLARLGDILQTLPTLEALKKQNPQNHITLVVRSTFASAALLSKHVDKLVEIPIPPILSPIFADEPSENAKQISLAKLEHWLKRDILDIDSEYDLLINLTFSAASGYLSSLIPAKEKRGMLRSKNNETYIFDQWSQYFYSQVQGKNYNILHLNDLFGRIAGVRDATWPIELANVESSNKVVAVEQGKIRIGIQLSASKSNKTMHNKAWATVCAKIFETLSNSELVFFGSNADKPQVDAVVEEISQLSGSDQSARCIKLAGTMPFHENINWVKTCHWVVSPDTAMVHMASLAQTKVIEIALSQIRPDETGPYGPGHHVLYPLNSDAGIIGREISNIILGNKVSSLIAHAVTTFRKCADGSHRSELVAENYVADEVINFFTKAYYLLYEFRCSGKQEDIEIPKLGDSTQKSALDKLVVAYDALCTARKLAEFGQHYSVKMLQKFDKPSVLKELLPKAGEVESLLDDLQKTVPLVRPLIDTWKVAKETSSATSDLTEVLAITEGAYRELGQNTEILQQLLQVAVDAAQQKLGKKAAKPVKSKTESL